MTIQTSVGGADESKNNSPPMLVFVPGAPIVDVNKIDSCPHCGTSRYEYGGVGWAQHIRLCEQRHNKDQIGKMLDVGDMTSEQFWEENDKRLGSLLKPEILKSKQEGGNHYKDLVIEPAEYCHKNKFQFCESEAIKYLSRFRKKKGAEDLKKAIHFVQMILEMEYGVVSMIQYEDMKEEQDVV